MPELLIITQCYENYGAHDWDGTGECPQYWKAKGGDEYLVTGIPYNVPVKAILDVDVLFAVVVCNAAAEVLGRISYEVVEDGYETPFEKDQRELEGVVRFKARRVAASDIVAVPEVEDVPFNSVLGGLSADFLFMKLPTLALAA